MKKPETLKKFYKKADEYMSVKADTLDIQKDTKNNTIKEGKSDESPQIIQKDDSEHKRGFDGRDSKIHKKSKFFKQTELTPLNETQDKISSTTKDSGMFPLVKPQRIT